MSPSIDACFKTTQSELLQTYMWRWISVPILKPIISMISSRQDRRTSYFRNVCAEEAKQLTQNQADTEVSDDKTKDLMNILSERAWKNRIKNRLSYASI
jgi:hypothetical protein